ncbi:hypothetical protein GCM10010232_17550 [Streptomyces amakusaensis]
MALVANRPPAGPLSPMDSIAAMPASTAGDSAVAEAWKTSTVTSAPPGGEGRDNVVRLGSGGGCADAAVPPPSRETVSETVRAPAPRSAVRARPGDLDPRRGVRCMGHPPLCGDDNSTGS